MKHATVIVPAAVALGLSLLWIAGPARAAQDPASHPPTSDQAAESTPAIPDRATLEARFQATLEKATFIGRWCSIQEGRMGPEQEDRYTIIGASKVGGDTWLIHTRIQYGQRDFVAPLPVQVKWAGDTPVITVDNLAMPGGTRRYSARVLVYGDTYAGTWSGGEHAGLLKGVITREPN
jgi:hypothetical protein